MIRGKRRGKGRWEQDRKVDVRLPGKGDSNSQREASPPDHHDDEVDSYQKVFNKERSLYTTADLLERVVVHALRR